MVVVVFVTVMDVLHLAISVRHLQHSYGNPTNGLQQEQVPGPGGRGACLWNLEVMIVFRLWPT